MSGEPPYPPALVPFAASLEALFPGETAAEGRLLVLPARPKAKEPLAVIVLRRVSADLSLVEDLPREDDLPFLNLVGAHLATALQNDLLYREAKEATRIRDEFLSLASHELRTPLTSLLLEAPVLRAHLDQPALVARAAGVIERQSERLRRLVDQLLDVSRIRVGRLHLDLEEADLVELANTVAAQLGPDLARAGSTLSLLAPGPVQVRCDPLRIEQVLANLLSNAVKFGEGKPIELAVEAVGDKARVRVRDHGPGLSPEDQARVFDRFERAVSARHFGGLGLGLYISRQIVEAHGGRIRVENVPGDGAAFSVELQALGRP